ncbi:MAG: hypothetical protein RLZZ299_427 [Pseudomonadota bacterium]|jgi:hypothetical protein
MLGVLLVAAAWAADARLMLEGSALREGQTVPVELVVNEARVRGVPALAVPEGLQMTFQGQSQQHTIVNFEATSSTTFRYALTALRRGAYILGPYTVETSAGPLQVAPRTVEVGARVAGGTDDLRVEVDTETAWVGQVLVYHMSFETEKALVQRRWSPPSAEGFLVEPSLEPEVSERRATQDGAARTIEELRVALRATAPGRRTLPGGLLQAQFVVARPRRGDPIFDELARFGDVRAEVFAAPARTVTVRPLPDVGRPADFSGLVGAFRIDATPSGMTLAVGDTLTLDVRVSGNGTLAGVKLPAADVPGFRVYDDAPQVTSSWKDGAYHAEATLKRALVALEAGRWTVPPIRLVTFDPVAGTWATLATDPVEVEVTGTAAPPAVQSFASPGSAVARTQAEDILPMRTHARMLRPLPSRWAPALLVPGAAWWLVQGLVALPRRRPRPSHGPVGWEPLPDDPDARVAACERRLREAVARRLGIAPDALRRDDLAALGAHAAEAEACWRILEAARYGGGAVLDDGRIRALVEGVS